MGQTKHKSKISILVKKQDSTHFKYKNRLVENKNTEKKDIPTSGFSSERERVQKLSVQFLHSLKAGQIETVIFLGLIRALRLQEKHTLKSGEFGASRKTS